MSYRGAYYCNVHGYYGAFSTDAACPNCRAGRSHPMGWTSINNGPSQPCHDATPEPLSPQARAVLEAVEVFSEADFFAAADIAMRPLLPVIRAYQASLQPDGVRPEEGWYWGWAPTSPDGDPEPVYFDGEHLHTFWDNLTLDGLESSLGTWRLGGPLPKEQ